MTRRSHDALSLPRIRASSALRTKKEKPGNINRLRPRRAPLHPLSSPSLAQSSRFLWFTPWFTHPSPLVSPDIAVTLSFLYPAWYWGFSISLAYLFIVK